MHYSMLLWPHPNARYQAETLKLAESELRIMLDRLAPQTRIAANDTMGMPCLDIEVEADLKQETVEALRRHSLMYGLFECRDGMLVPVAGRASACVGADLPAILKYKGKTNEMFLQLLINVALYSGEFWQRGAEALSLMDPMCGRGTALFVAANFGWDAIGADVDKNELKEAERFFKRYLEYHRFKHDIRRESRTLRKGTPAAMCRFEYASSADAPRRALSLICLDAAQTCEALGKSHFHVIACDLPYGVRHDAQLSSGLNRGGNWLETVLAKALPDWCTALKPGGTVAVSFNAQSFKPDRLRGLMTDAGLEVLSGGAYDRFSHWVEQAITRDIAICKKPI